VHPPQICLISIPSYCRLVPSEMRKKQSPVIRCVFSKILGQLFSSERCYLHILTVHEAQLRVDVKASHDHCSCSSSDVQYSLTIVHQQLFYLD
jgi:hypothetical protein